MAIEVWDSASGNMIHDAPDLDEALQWTFALWQRDGDEALSTLSIGDEDARWVVRGEQLRLLVARLLLALPLCRSAILAGMQDVELTLKSARIVRIFLEDPAHPRYQLELMRCAKMGSGSVYPILARLVKAGWLATSREDIDPVAEGRPRRTLYSLTEEAIPVARAKIAALAAEFNDA